MSSIPSGLLLGEPIVALAASTSVVPPRHSPNAGEKRSLRPLPLFFPAGTSLSPPPLVLRDGADEGSAGSATPTPAPVPLPEVAPPMDTSADPERAFSPSIPPVNGDTLPSRCLLAPAVPPNAPLPPVDLILPPSLPPTCHRPFACGLNGQSLWQLWGC